ncbi:MAG: response regulator [Paracoccaceae bacterium]
MRRNISRTPHFPLRRPAWLDLKRPGLRDEVLRQRDRSAGDLVSREAAVALTCLLFAVYLPALAVGLIYVFLLLTEVVEIAAYRAFARGRGRHWYTVILVNSFAGLAAFSLLGVLAWTYEDPLIRFVGVLSIVGALINVSSERSMHLPVGVICGIPPSAALLYIASQDLLTVAGWKGSVFATAAALSLIGYFSSALFQNHRIQARLEGERARAQAASEAKSRFLSEMGHEMRTPLNTIVGLSQTLPESHSPGDIAARIADIGAAARDFADLVDELIGAEAATEGQVTARPAAVTVRTEMEAAARSVARALARTHEDGAAVPSAARVADDIPEIMRFDAALVRKYLRHAAVSAGIAPGKRDAGGVKLSCDRAGPGTLAVTLRIGGGSGEGGPDVAKPAAGRPGGVPPAADMHGSLLSLFGATGTVSADPPGAVTVRLRFPAGPMPAAEARPDSPPPRQALRAIVVDDIATNRFVVVTLLRGLGIEADEAESGDTALAALRCGRFGLVLLDMNMPGMDGEATLRAIRNLDGPAAKLPVIALTAGGVPGQRERYAALGMDGFVAKPVDRRLLAAEIDAAIAWAGLRSASRRG